MKFSIILSSELLESGQGRQEFAKKIKVSRTTLHKYLCGDTVPTFDKACDILKICNRNVIIAKEYSYKEWFGRMCEECDERRAIPNNSRCNQCLISMT